MTQTKQFCTRIGLLAVMSSLCSTVALANPAHTIFAAENALYGSGYDIGTADGWMDEQLRSAISSFQSDMPGLQKSGNLDKATLAALGVVYDGNEVNGNQYPNRQAAIKALKIPAPKNTSVVTKVASVPNQQKSAATKPVVAEAPAPKKATPATASTPASEAKKAAEKPVVQKVASAEPKPVVTPEQVARPKPAVAQKPVQQVAAPEKPTSTPSVTAASNSPAAGKSVTTATAEVEKVNRMPATAAGIQTPAASQTQPAPVTASSPAWKQSIAALPAAEPSPAPEETTSTVAPTADPAEIAASEARASAGADPFKTPEPAATEQSEEDSQPGFFGRLVNLLFGWMA